jgi:hypothetical protein
MKMKKMVVVATLVVGLGLTGIQMALARGPKDGGQHMPSNEREWKHSMQKLDNATLLKLDKFEEDTQDLRKQMVMKRAEEFALMRSESPDIEAVGKVAGELFDLRMAMREKARTAGVIPYLEQEDKEGINNEKGVKIEKFFKDTQDLRRNMHIKMAQEHALMRSSAPNIEMAAKIAGELFDLRTSIHQQAKVAGLPDRFGQDGKPHMGPGGHFGHGGHAGYFGHGGHHGMMEEPWHDEMPGCGGPPPPEKGN